MMLRLRAYEEFRERLHSGELKPGQFVTQRELAKLVGVPLGAAREAIICGLRWVRLGSP